MKYICSFQTYVRTNHHLFFPAERALAVTLHVFDVGASIRDGVNAAWIDVSVYYLACKINFHVLMSLTLLPLVVKSRYGHLMKTQGLYFVVLGRDGVLGDAVCLPLEHSVLPGLIWN